MESVNSLNSLEPISHNVYKLETASSNFWKWNRREGIKKFIIFRSNKWRIANINISKTQNINLKYGEETCDKIKLKNKLWHGLQIYFYNYLTIICLYCRMVLNDKFENVPSLINTHCDHTVFSVSYDFQNKQWEFP